MTNYIARLAERITRLERNVRAGQSSPQLGTSSIENGGAIKERGPDGTTYQWIGRQFDGTHTTTQMNGPTPPAPTSPGASWSPGGINVSWDGMFETGPIAPMDLLRVDVHILDDEHTDPLLYQPVGSLPYGTGGSVSVLTGPGEYYAALVAWTTSGKFAVSQPSNEVVVEALTVELPDPTDGVAPVVAPVVSGRAFGVGAVEFEWPEIANDDPVRYRYWASLTPGITATGEGDGWVFTPNIRISKVDGVQVPMDGTPVYIKVAAYDDDGVGPVSAEASATARSPEVETFFAELVGALEIEAAQIRGAFISADLALLSALQVGERLEIDGETSVITIFANELDEAGERIPLIQLDPDGSTFRGRVIADDVSVLQGLIMQGEMSQIAENAGLTIMAGVGSPNMPPGLSATVKTATWPAVPDGYYERGACWDASGTRYLRLLVPIAPAGTDLNGAAIVERISTAGAITSQVTLANISGAGEEDFNSIAAHGGSYYVMFKGSDYWDVAKFSATTGDFQAKSDPGGSSYSSPAFGYEDGGSYLHKGIARPALCIQRRPSGTYQVAAWAWVDSSDSVIGTWWQGAGLYGVRYDLDLVGVTRHSRAETSVPTTKSLSFAKMWTDGTDAGAHLWIGFGTQMRHYGYTGSAYARADTVWPPWTLNANGNVIDERMENADLLGLSSVGGGGSVRWIYSGHIQETNEKLWVTYANTEGSDTTLDSPAGSLAVPTGRFVQIALPPGGEGIDGADVFTALSTTGLPADALLKKRAETLTAERTMLIDPSVAGGASTPPAVNTFTGGVAGWLRTQSGGFELNGDGTGDWPHLRDLILTEDTPNNPMRPKAGSVSITPTAKNVTNLAHVTFGTPFPAGTVVIVTTDVTTTNGASTITSHATGANNEGFDARLVVHSSPDDPNPSLSARTVSWTATPQHS